MVQAGPFLGGRVRACVSFFWGLIFVVGVSTRPGAEGQSRHSGAEIQELIC